MSEEEKTPDSEKPTSGDATDSSPMVYGMDSGTSGDTGDAPSLKIDAAKLVLEAFEVNQVGGDYQITVNADLKRQLDNGAITREEFNEKIATAQKVLASDMLAIDGKKWMGLSDGKEIPTLTPFTETDIAIVKDLEAKQNAKRIAEAEKTSDDKKKYFDDISQAFDIEQDETGGLFLRQNPKATPEAMEKAAKALGEMGWTSAATTEKGKDGKDLVTYKPTTDKETGFLTDFYVYEETGNISGGLAAGKSATLIGGEGKEEGNIEGGDADKGGDPTMHIDTGFGDGSSLFEGRSLVDGKQFSELGVGIGDTVSDVLISQIEKFFEKLNADVKLYYTWTLNAFRNRDTNAAETLRDFCLDKDDKHPGAISNITSQILKGDREGAEATLKDIWNFAKRCNNRDVDIKAIKRSLKEVDKILGNNKDVLEKYKNGIPGYEGRGKEVADMLAPALKKMSIGVANKYEIKTSRSNAVSTARAGRGAYTP